jgi:hypothetical protein
MNGPGSGSPAVRSDSVAVGGACLAVVTVVVVVVAVPAVQEANFSDDEVGAALTADDDEAGLAAEDEADLAAEDEAGLAAEDEAGLAAKDEAGLAAEDEAGLTADTADAGLPPEGGMVLAADLFGAGLGAVVIGAVLSGVSTSTNAFVLAMALRAACVVALPF